MRVRLFSPLVAVTAALVTPGAAQTVTPTDSTLLRADSAAARSDTAAARPNSTILRPDSAVVPPDSAAERGDSLRRAAPRDTAGGAAAASGASPAPPAVPPVDPAERAVCTKVDSLGGTVHGLAVVFQTGTQAETRDAALATIEAKRLRGREDGVQYVLVPAGPGFNPRDAEDRMIRLPSVEQVRSVRCPALPAP